MNFTFAVIINASALRCFYLLVKNKLQRPSQNHLIIVLRDALAFFTCLICMNILKAGYGTVLIWAQPLTMMIIFVLIDTAAPKYP